MDNMTHNPWEVTVTDLDAHALDFSNMFGSSAKKMEVVMRMRSGSNVKFSVGQEPGDNSPEYDATNFKEDIFTLTNDKNQLYYQPTSATGQQFAISF